MSVALHTSPARHPSEQSSFVAGVDSLRLFAAAMVAVCHLARNLPVAPPGEAEALLFRQLALVANGQAAVGLFFVISGFCIHLGQSTNLKVEALPFLVKRTLRIGLPLVIMSGLAASLGNWAATALNSVLWSLYCELAYYLTYPVLLACRRNISMGRLLLISVLISAMLVMLQPRREFLQDYGLATALVCYPLWLAGAWLAERHDRARPPSRVSVHIWRVGALGLCWLFPFGPYGPVDVSAAIKLGIVGAFSFFYIPAELAAWRETRFAIGTERLGRASYSLYLVHILPVAYFMLVPMGMPFWPTLAIETAAIAVTALATYRLCEEPSHRIAKSIGDRVLRFSLPWSATRAPR